MTAQIDDRDLSAVKVAEVFGIPVQWIYDWKRRGKLVPCGLVDGRGRTGKVPLYRLSEVAKVLADRHAEPTEPLHPDDRLPE